MRAADKICSYFPVDETDVAPVGVWIPVIFLLRILVAFTSNTRAQCACGDEDGQLGLDGPITMNGGMTGRGTCSKTDIVIADEDNYVRDEARLNIRETPMQSAGMDIIRVTFTKPGITKECLAFTSVREPYHAFADLPITDARGFNSAVTGFRVDPGSDLIVSAGFEPACNEIKICRNEPALPEMPVRAGERRNGK